jgi:hypothetical protein
MKETRRRSEDERGDLWTGLAEDGALVDDMSALFLRTPCAVCL